MARHPTNEPSWYKDAVVYETHVRAFQDSNADGIGDLPGMTERLDYLQDLGVTAIWLLPFYPSPLRDDGYDIADYRNVHPAYGTLRDFRRFLREAHRRRLHVITEVVINHTSDQHPWFQRARHAPAGSPERDYYLWSDTPDRFRDARIIFGDTENSNWAWDPIAGAYYWHRFFSHQPDLNFDNPAVPKAIQGVVDFWLDMGVDGLRLDAVPYLYEREGTSCENLPETHVLLKRLRSHLDRRFPDRMFLAEANQWPEDAIAYFGEGDECHMAFHFPLMPRIFMGLRMENRFPIIDILEQTPPIPESAQWGLFLRNHDELTLEMVTDEERDYMYRHYARDRRARLNLGIRRRLAPLLGNSRREIELVNALLLSLPGTPFLYYGDEIGMGDNIYLGDRNSVRTPMQWSSDRNAGFSEANPQRLYLPVIINPEYHYETVNVEAQAGNSNSLLWWTRNMLALRRRHRVFGRGTIEFLHPENERVLAYLRREAEETVLVVANLSRYSQYVELDLAEFSGLRPLELFGQTEFPAIGDLPYLLTLGAHGYLWFRLAGPPAGPPLSIAGEQITLPGSSETAFHDPVRHDLELALARYLPTRPWFGRPGRGVREVILQDVIPLGRRLPDTYLTLLEADYLQGESEWFLVPLSIAFGEDADDVRRRRPELIVAEVAEEDLQGIAFDAAGWPPFVATLVEMIRQRKGQKGEEGAVAFQGATGMLPPATPHDPTVEVFDNPEGHTTIALAGRCVLKLYRRIELGVNPDLEVRLFLTERTPLSNLPQVFGWAQYQRPDSEPAVLAILQEFVRHSGTPRDQARRSLDRLFDAASSEEGEGGIEVPQPGPLDLVDLPPPAILADLVGPDLASLGRLGERVAGLHRGLASDDRDPDFRPERYTELHQRSLFQALRSSLRQSLRRTRAALPGLPEEARGAVESVGRSEPVILEQLRDIATVSIDAARIRIHGDLGLDAVLADGDEFIFYDFAGDTTSPIGDRRLLRSPLWDVADMLRSLHETALAAAAESAGLPGGPPLPTLEPWALAWQRWAAAAFLHGYLSEMEGQDLLPADPDHLRLLLGAFLLEKTARHLAREAAARRPQAWIPARGLLDTLGWLAPGG
ncbi:MAG TPA: maltose alpha-D-glucosyltransferase [Acidimicrobiia bacterium]|nr:maltose alpha-D-glucosyltransferase [Acidimicrobiia bacterium]